MWCYRYLFLMGILGLCGTAEAVMPQVHDTLVPTVDRTCAIHYLSQGNTVGWFLTDVEGSCPYGVLQGEGYGVIRNAFGKEVERISGFFTQGYWTGAEELEVPLVTLYLRDAETQTLSFDLGKEDRLDIRYLGKMTATRRPDDSYGPFMACEPASVLAQTQMLDLFEDEAVQQELINSVINRVQAVCPDVEQIYFYGSEKENPENQDIAFFAEIDLANRQIRVRRLPSSERSRDVLNYPEERMPVAPKPAEVRVEKSLPIVEVHPIKERRAPKRQENYPVVETHTVSIPQPVEVPEVPKVLPVTQVEKIPEPEAPVVVEAAKPIEVPAPIQPEVLDAVPNLLTAARLLNQPVDGKALVRIDRFEEDGSAVAEEPVVLTLRGKHLSIGWGIVEGAFSYVPPTDKISGPRGFVRVKNFTPYHQE